MNQNQKRNKPLTASSPTPSPTPLLSAPTEDAWPHEAEAEGEQDKQPPIFPEAVLVAPDALAILAQPPARVPAQHGIAETTG